MIFFEMSDREAKILEEEINFALGLMIKEQWEKCKVLRAFYEDLKENKL